MTTSTDTMQDYKSDIAKLFEKKFKKLKPSKQIEAVTQYNYIQKKKTGKDTRNLALKELDKPTDELTSLFKRPEGTFDSEQEFQKENEIKKQLETDKNISKETRKKYLMLLQKRMRTA